MQTNVKGVPHLLQVLITASRLSVHRRCRSENLATRCNYFSTGVYPASSLDQYNIIQLETEGYISRRS